MTLAGRVGHREDRDQVGDAALADEPLRAVEDVVVAITNRLRGDRARVGSRPGLGDRERDEGLAGGQVGQPARLLLVGAGHHDRQRGELVDGQDEAGRGACRAEGLDREAGRQQVGPEAAVLDRVGQAQDVVGRQELLDVPGELGRPVDLGGARSDPLPGDLADAVAQGALLVGQAKGGRRVGHDRAITG